MSNEITNTAYHTEYVDDAESASDEVFWEQAGVTALVMFLLVTFVVCLWWFAAKVAPAFERYTQSAYSANFEFVFNSLALLSGFAVMVMTVRVIQTYFPDKG
jgi:succinate dehydrogenase hydrophobic anchor subunit